jgi:hypothetical protein
MKRPGKGEASIGYVTRVRKRGVWKRGHKGSVENVKTGAMIFKKAA